MFKLKAVVLAASLASYAAHAGEMFPWAGEQRLESKEGALVWTVKKSEGEVLIEGKHPKWTVTHRCAPDGSPRETVKTTGGRKSRLLWTTDGVEFTFDVSKKDAPKKIPEKGLWDGDTLDARLAGIGWTKGKKVEFRIVDTEKDAGDVVPMSAEYDGEEKCAVGPCHQVTMKYTGFGAIFVAPWLYRFGTGPGAPYQHYAHEKEKFSAK